ncbi:MAG: permease-like cell division protein FtsX [Ruminococcus sp.]|nr:permease-like cell division protein FtsX [Ruminococcus sp.]
MKLSSFRYLVHQGFKGVWKNRMMTFASFCILLVSLLMVGVSVLTAINLNRIISSIEGQSEIMVVVRDDATEDQIAELGDMLRDIPNINKVELYAKEDAWKDMMDGMTPEAREVFEYADDDIPYPDTFRVTVHDIKIMSDTTEQINTFPAVESTKSPTGWADALISIRRIFTIVAFAVVFALVVVSLVIISNTTRASVFARRKEINIMKYVGATNSFIRVPFFIEGMIVGICAAGAALVLTKFAYEGLYNIFSDSFNIMKIMGLDSLYSFKELFVPIAASYLGAGALIGALGTSFSTGKHLKV